MLLPRLGFAMRTVAAMLLLLLVGACAGHAPVAKQAGIVLPLQTGWFQGEPVHYVTTDISDRAMARMAGANWVPRLANVLPGPTPQPGYRSALDRVYKFAAGEQGSVLPSAPQPLGGDNQQRAYSPLWQVVMVYWQTGKQVRVLKSEQDVLTAEDAGDIRLEALPIIVNCPVIGLGKQFLPGVSLP